MAMNPADHFVEIYRGRAFDYHQMITAEDVAGNLLPALRRLTPLAGKRIVDLGTGTGRLPLLFGQQAGQMLCLDLHAAMLREHQRRQLAARGRWLLTQADMRWLPIRSGWADVVIAGWAIGHFVGWFGQAWPRQISQVLAEMARIAAPGGVLIILETLGTGSLSPAPPSQGLARYYAWLEQNRGFERQEIQTDYQFASVEEAVARTEFFFGPELAAKVRRQRWTRLPEWTGVWAKQL